MIRQAAGVALLLVFAFTGGAHGRMVFSGPSFDLATSVSGAYLYDVAVAPQGNALLLFENTDGVFVRALDVHGQVMGGAVPVSPDRSSYGPPQIVALANGQFIVTWYRSGPRRIVARCFDADGAARGLVRRVSSDDQVGDRTALATVGGDRVLVAWRREGDLVRRILESNCSPAGAEMAVATRGGGSPIAATDGQGRVLLVWDVIRPGPIDPFQHIDGLLFDASATPVGDPFTVSTDGAAGLPAGDPRGGFVVAYRAGSDVVVQRIDGTGTLSPPLRSEVLDHRGSALDEHIAVDIDGSMLLVVSLRGGLREGILAFDLTPEGALRPIEDAILEIHPEFKGQLTLSRGLSGRFLVTWIEYAAPGPGAVRGRVITRCGNAVRDPDEACDDGNSRGGDCCSALCLLEQPDAAECWLLGGVSTLRFHSEFRLNGRPVVCYATCKEVALGGLIVESDDRYRFPGGGELQCIDGGSVVVPDETGTLRRTGRRRFVAKPENLTEIRALMDACADTRLHQMRSAFTVRDDFHMQATQHSRIAVRGDPPITVRVRTRLKGINTRLGEPLDAKEVSDRRRCETPVTLRCRYR